MSPTKNGEVKEIVVELENKDRIRVNLWRACTAVAITVGAEVQIWDCATKYNEYLRQQTLNVNIPSDIKV